MGSASYSIPGIYIFDGNTVSKICDYRTKSLTFDAEGRLWVTYHDPDISKKDMHLAVLENGIWTDYTDDIALYLYPDLNKALTVQTATDSSVWVNNLDKYGIWRNGEWSFHSGGNYTVPVFLKFDKSGRVWGYGSNKLYKLDSNGKWELMRELNFGPSDRKYFLAETPDSTLWISDTSDVYHYVNNQWVIVNTPYDLASDIVTCSIYTSDGDLICGHGLRGLNYEENENCGVSIRTGDMWNNYNKYENIFLYNIYQFERMPSGEIMAYTDVGLEIYDEIDNSWQNMDSLHVFIQTDMAWDNNNKMWITTEIGLVEFSDPEFEIIIPFEKEKYIKVDNLTINYDNILFMQQRPEGDIISYDDYDETWEIVIADDGMTNDFTIAEDGTIWGARVNGLSYWNNDLTKWNSVVTLDNGKFIHIDETGRIWSSGYGNTGYYENGTWHRIQELTDSASDCIAMNSDGNVALNVFDSERENFYGFFEYLPNSGLGNTDKVPVSSITAGNYPNPFNSFTSINFELPSTEIVTITVLSVTGQRVKKLSNRRFPAGKNSVVWDAKSDYGNPCASGVYFYRIKAGAVVKTGKMLLIQ